MTLPMNIRAEVIPAAERWRGFSFGAVMLAVLALTACTSPPVATPARPNVNLSGYPAEFRQGYADGCNSVRGRMVRDEMRMKGDIQYAAGWRDGNDICRR